MSSLTATSGSGKEELGHRKGLDWLVESLYPVSYTQGLWRRQGLRARKWQHRFLPEGYRVPCARREGAFGPSRSR